MYSDTNRRALFGIILSVFNIIASILLLVYVLYAQLPVYVKFFAIIFLATSSIILALVCGSLRTTCQDMRLNDETYSTKLTDLRKRVEALENRPH